MKYKLEFWPYGEFETEEAAERLNQRAGEGWELVNVVTLFIAGACGLALYRRNTAEGTYRYTADIVPKDGNEEYFAFCRDAGWEPLIRMESGVQIFVCRDGRGHPLHTSCEVEYDHQLKVFAENHGDDSLGTYLTGIIVWLGLLWWMFGYRDKELIRRLVGLAGWLTNLACMSIMYCANIIYIRYARRRAEEGELVKRPVWMAKLFKAFSIFISAEFFCAVVACFYFTSMIVESAVSLIALHTALLMFFLMSVWLKMFKKRNKEGNFLMTASILGYIAVIEALALCS